MIKALAYCSLALALLNTAEIIGVVEPGRYFGFLPRWDTDTFPPFVQQFISRAQYDYYSAQSRVQQAASITNTVNSIQLPRGVHYGDRLSFTNSTPSTAAHY